MELVIPTTYFSSVSVNERVVFELILIMFLNGRIDSAVLAGIRTENLNAMR